MMAFNLKSQCRWEERGQGGDTGRVSCPVSPVLHGEVPPCAGFICWLSFVWSFFNSSFFKNDVKLRTTLFSQ